MRIQTAKSAFGLTWLYALSCIFYGFYGDVVAGLYVGGMLFFVGVGTSSMYIHYLSAPAVLMPEGDSDPPIMNISLR